MAFVTLILLLCSIPSTSSISLTDRPTTENRNLLPASHLVDLKFDTDDCPSFQHNHQLPVSNGATFFSQLRRRDGLCIYGKDIVHTPDEPNYATLRMLPLTADMTKHDEYEWEATLLLTPSQPTFTRQDGVCFVAMNRFAVKEDCQDLFEQRWAERSSKLPEQSGFLSFCLIRKKETSHCKVPFNYSSLTLWKSFDAWKTWRNGDGRYSHDASRRIKRTPVSAWLEHSASPIFWDGTKTIIAESGI